MYYLGLSAILLKLSLAGENQPKETIKDVNILNLDFNSCSCLMGIKGESKIIGQLKHKQLIVISIHFITTPRVLLVSFVKNPTIIFQIGCEILK